MHVDDPKCTYSATCQTEGCQLCNNFNILVTTWPITLRLRMYVGTHDPPSNVSLYVTVGVRLHVRTCKATMLQISRTGGPIALKFGTRLGTG